MVEQTWEISAHVKRPKKGCYALCGDKVVRAPLIVSIVLIIRPS